ncbi:cache domain-containing protein [Microbacterium sp. KR10-403]|uniref:cache domain-containing protein n=1 Tax=Microbacterium sp. KR10-403 TaxID=3158581 RepID=UPI0032E49275
MIRTITDTASAAAHLVETFTPLIDLVELWRRDLELFFEGASEVDSAQIDAHMQRLAVPRVTADGTAIVGAGFVATPGRLADAQWHLAWWLSPPAPGTSARRLATSANPDSESFRDYTALEWWRVPVQTGRRHLTGPYIDFLCTDDYTITVTAPVRDGDTAGVTGIDLDVARLERLLLPALLQSDASLTLVNASARTVLSTDPRTPTGAILRVDGLSDALAAAARSGCTSLSDRGAVVACGDTGLFLVQRR